MNKKTLSLTNLSHLLAASAIPRFNKKEKDLDGPGVDLIEFAKARKVNKKLAKNTSKDWLRIVNQESTREATIYIYDEISWFGVLAEDVIQQIQDLDVDTIHVRINSPGGSVFEGVAIANLLKAHKAKVITYNDSLAASIATIIFLAGDDRHVADNSLFMMHKPSSIVWGTAEEMRQEAEVLDMIEGTLLTTYENGSNLERSELVEMIAAETWLDAKQCVEHGLADAEFEPSQMAASADRSKFDFSAFHNAPEKETRKNKSATKTSTPSGDEGPVNETPPLSLLEREAEALQLNK